MTPYFYILQNLPHTSIIFNRYWLHEPVFKDFSFSVSAFATEPFVLSGTLSTTLFFCHILIFPKFPLKSQRLCPYSLCLPSLEEKGNLWMKRCGDEKWQQWPEKLAEVGREVLSGSGGGGFGESVVRLSSVRGSASSPTSIPFKDS